MANGDVALKVWLGNKERFADLFNGTIFEGKQVIKANELEDKKSESVAVIENKNEEMLDKGVQRYRDITMLWRGKYNLMILACENQERVNYGMPIRMMVYDGLSYTDQIKEFEEEINQERNKKTDIYYLKNLGGKKLIPTLTLVFYYGERQWDGAKDLYGMFGMTNKDEISMIEKYIPNYRINVIETRKIKDYKQFKSDLQIVLNMLNYRKDKEKMRRYIEENAEYFEHLSKETLAAIGMLLNVKDKFNNILNRDRKEYSMCKALDDIYNDGINEGVSQGISQGIIDLIIKKINKGKELDMIADELETDVESLEELYNIVLKYAPDFDIEAIYKELENSKK